ncbi:MAG: cytidylate kinase-like family protein [Desulfobacterales bacterium]|nr:cytidylate kinase-like family protein [Desulfobacterales bacterium]
MAVITISRQFGAGGRTLGRAVAKQLGFPFLDNELIQKVAEKARVSNNWVASIEKEAGGRLLRFVSGLVSRGLIDRILDDERGYIDEEIYLDLLGQIIRQIAEEGDAVILGRGSQYILRDSANAFHVLLVGEKADRVRFMEEHYELNPSRAVKVVNMEDRRRANLYRKFGREDYDDPILYHLVLNMSHIHMDRACWLICRLISG